MGKINKILIIGNSGSGKSTLAKELNDELNLGYYEIDSYRWNKDWSRVSEDIFENKLTDLTKNKAWIIEDGSKISIEKFKNDADIIIWLKINVFVCLIRLIKRSLLRWLKKDIKSPEPIIMALKHWRHCLKYKLNKKEVLFESILENQKSKIIAIKNKEDKQKLVKFLKGEQWEN